MFTLENESGHSYPQPMPWAASYALFAQDHWVVSASVSASYMLLMYTCIIALIAEDHWDMIYDHI